MQRATDPQPAEADGALTPALTREIVLSERRRVAILLGIFARGLAAASPAIWLFPDTVAEVFRGQLSPGRG